MTGNVTSPVKKFAYKKPAWLTQQQAPLSVVKDERSNRTSTPVPKSEHQTTSNTHPGATLLSPIVISDENDMFSRKNDTQKHIQALKDEKERRRAGKRKQKELERARDEAKETEGRRKRDEQEAQRAAQSIEHKHDLLYATNHSPRESTHGHGSSSRRERDPKRRRISEEEGGESVAAWIGSGSDSGPATPKRHGRSNSKMPPASISVRDSDDEIIITGSQNKSAAPSAPTSGTLQFEDDDLYAVSPRNTDSEDDELVVRARAERRQRELAKQEEDIQHQKRHEQAPFTPQDPEKRAQFGFSSPDTPNLDTHTRTIRQTAELSDRDRTDPVIRIFISSKIPDTQVALILRRYKQPLAQVRIGWLKQCAKSATGLDHGSVYFTWKGEKVYSGLQTLSSLGVQFQWKCKEDGNEGEMEVEVLNASEEGPGIYEEERMGGVHFVATTAQIEEREQQELAQEVQGNEIGPNSLEARPTTAEAEQNGQNIRIKTCLRSKDFEDFKLLLKPTTSLSLIVKRFRDRYSIPVATEISAFFEGERLEPHLTVADTELMEAWDGDDALVLDMHIRNPES